MLVVLLVVLCSAHTCHTKGNSEEYRRKPCVVVIHACSDRASGLGRVCQRVHSDYH